MYRFFMESIKEAKTLSQLKSIVREIHANEVLDKGQMHILLKYAIKRMKEIPVGKVINKITEFIF